jgi:hypothetical protein
MPLQHRARPDQPVAAQRTGQPACQRGQDRPIGPIQPRPGTGAPQHRQFVPQHQQLGVLRRGRASEQRQPPDEADEDQVQQPQRHGRRSSRTSVTAASCRSSACIVLEPHRASEKLTVAGQSISGTPPSTLDIISASAKQVVTSRWYRYLTKHGVLKLGRRARTQDRRIMRGPPSLRAGAACALTLAAANYPKIQRRRMPCRYERYEPARTAPGEHSSGSSAASSELVTPTGLPAKDGGVTSPPCSGSRRGSCGSQPAPSGSTEHGGERRCRCPDQRTVKFAVSEPTWIW